MEKKAKITPLLFFTVFCLGMSFAVMYSLPYIKAVFYEGMIQLTGGTNAQLGALMTIYGIGEVLTPGIGGILARKYDYKKVITISCFGGVLACVLLALFPSLTMCIVCWFILVFATLFMVWGTWFKVLRIMAPDEIQGTMTGLFYGCCGVGYIVVNGLGLVVYSQAGVGNDAQGMVGVLYTFAAVLAVFTIISHLLMKKVGVRNQAVIDSDKRLAEQKVSVIEDMKAVAKYRSVWYFGITLFCMYSAAISVSYFTPYFTDVLGTTVVFSSLFAIIRSYGMKVIGSPIGGVIADKTKSISKTIIGSFVVTAVCIVMVLILPKGFKSMGVLMAILLVASFANNIAGGIQYAIPTEANVPVEYYASAIGFGSAIGFSPDLFQHVLHGYWIDKYGNAGYNYIMIYGIVACVIGIIALAKFLSEKKRDAAAAALAK